MARRKVEGSGAQLGNRIIATSTISAAAGRADQRARFKIETRDFTAPDCKIVVSDGSRTPTATVTSNGPIRGGVSGGSSRWST